MRFYATGGDTRTVSVDPSARNWEAVVVVEGGRVVLEQDMPGDATSFTFTLPDGYSGPFEIHLRRKGTVRVAAEGVCIPTQGECP